MNAVDFGRQIELRPLRRLETLLRWMDAAAVSPEMRSMLEESIEDLRDVTLSLLASEEDDDASGPITWSGVGEDDGFSDEDGRWKAPLEAAPASRLPGGFQRNRPEDPGAMLPQIVAEVPAAQGSLMGPAGLVTPSEAEEPTSDAATAQALLEGEDEVPEAAITYQPIDLFEDSSCDGYAVGDDELIYPGDDEADLHSCDMSLPAPVYYMLEDLEARIMVEKDEDFDLVRMVEDEVLRLWDG